MQTLPDLSIKRGDFSSRFIFNSIVCFDAEQGRLFHCDTGKVLKLPPVSSRLMLVLCRNPNMLLLRKELMKSVWEDYGTVVSQNSLNQSVSTLRDSLETLDPKHKYIKTLPRIGYGFFAEVVELGKSSRITISEGQPVSS